MRVIIVDDHASSVLLTNIPMKTFFRVAGIPPLLTSSSVVYPGMMVLKGVTSRATIFVAHNHVALIFYSRS